MVKVPCQEIVWDIIPAIQAALAAELVNLGVSQIQVAKSLSLAPSAVSQYLSGKRGYRIVFDDEIKDIIIKLAEEIKSGSITDDELKGKFCKSAALSEGVMNAAAHLSKTQNLISLKSQLNFYRGFTHDR